MGQDNEVLKFGFVSFLTLALVNGIVSARKCLVLKAKLNLLSVREF